MLLYALGLELTVLLTFWLCLAVWQKDRSTPGRTTFVALGVATSVWCLGELFHQRGFGDELAGDRLRYLGILALPPFWLGLAGHATRLELARRVPWFPLVLLAPSACLYALMFGGPWSGLFLVTIPEQVDRHGPLWWTALAYAYTLVLAGCALFVVSAFRWRVPGRWTRRLAVGVAPLVPLAGNVAYIADGMSWPVDPTPLFFCVSLLALHGAIFTGGLLQALPISQHDLIEQLPLGVILTDRAGVVIDVNPAAERRLGISEAQAVGRSLDAILAGAGNDVQAEIAPVFSNQREAGQLVLIDPPAKSAG
jgi:PAS domain-containing protein